MRIALTYHYILSFLVNITPVKQHAVNVDITTNNKLFTKEEIDNAGNLAIEKAVEAANKAYISIDGEVTAALMNILLLED